MNPPDRNLNLCLVGGVSTGKSTSLNALFLKDLSECKIKRTTMVPTVYVESASVFPQEHYAGIYAKVAETNAALIAKSESGSVDKTDYAELVFQVGKLDIDIAGCLVNVYDIPGLNDARTKTVYMDYLTAKFAKFNVVVLFVDIMSGLNTSDEMDIVRFLAKNTATHHAAGRDVYTLVVVNKADDMQLGADGALSLTGELADMFAQVERTVRAEFSAVPDHVIGIIPLCALDAYLYRMVRKYGRDFQLSPQQVLKIGVNEQGKKFSKLSAAAQEQKVRDILEDEKFIGDMIQLSGFRGLEQTLQLFLETKFTKMSTDNLLMQLKDTGPALDKALAAGHFPWLLEQLKKETPLNPTIIAAHELTDTLVKTHLGVYRDLRKFNPSKAEESTQSLFEKLRKANYEQFMDFQRHFIRDPRYVNLAKLTQLLKNYEDFGGYAGCWDDFEDYNYSDAYPPYIVESAFEAALKTNFSNIEFLDKLGCLDLDHASRFIASWFEAKDSLQVMSEVIHGNPTAAHKVDPSKMETFVLTLHRWNPILEALGVSMEEFMRSAVFKVNDAKISARTGHIPYWEPFGHEEYIRRMIYTTAGEIPVRLQLETFPKHMISGTVELVALIKKDYRDDPRFALDFMYLNYC
jgi:GTP-binding protein EngB required for normal cell division